MYSTTTTTSQPQRDEYGRFTSENAWVAQRTAEAQRNAERRERNRQAEAQYGLTPGDIIFA